MTRGLAWLGACALAACINEGERPVGDVDGDAAEAITPDGADGDVADGDGVDDAIDDADDSAEAGSEDAHEPEVIVTTCARATDCREVLPACQYWVCPAGVCEAQPRDSGPCDDGDLCTGVGTCVLGQCEPGPTLTCEATAACTRPTCDPASGCGTEIVAGGFCEAGGAPWGSCVGERMAPFDRCDGNGQCAAGGDDPSLPIPEALVLGDWFVIVQSMQSDTLSSVAGGARFFADGTWSGAFENLDGPFAVDGDDAVWCMDPEGGVAFDLGFDHFVGQLDTAGEYFAGSGSLGHEVAVAVRPRGDVIDFDGSYFAVVSLPSDDGRLETWTGAFSATLGCMDDDALLVAGDDREPILVASAGACLEIAAGGLVSTSLPIDAGTGASELTLAGAIGPRGDVALFHRRVSEALAFGSVVLVRLAGPAADQFRGESRWHVAFQEMARAGLYRDAHGALLFRDDLLVNGSVSGESVLGNDIGFDDYGRFVMRLQTPSLRRVWSGYLAAGGGFGVFYEVAAPSTWASLFEVTEAPAWPMLGLIVRRP